jgi:hypothetical protein
MGFEIGMLGPHLKTAWFFLKAGVIFALKE